MARLSTNLPTIMRIALLLLLLSMQSFSSAHELDRGEVHDSSVCVSCSIGSGHDGIPSIVVDFPVTTSSCKQPAFTPIAAPAAALRQNPEARAPPITL